MLLAEDDRCRLKLVLLAWLELNLLMVATHLAALVLQYLRATCHINPTLLLSRIIRTLAVMVGTSQMFNQPTTPMDLRPPTTLMRHLPPRTTRTHLLLHRTTHMHLSRRITHMHLHLATMRMHHHKTTSPNHLTSVTRVSTSTVDPLPPVD